MRFLIVAFLVLCGSVMASDIDVDLVIGIGGRAPMISSGGYYVTRYETVLVEPERIVREWVPPTYEFRMIDDKPVAVQTNPGYWRDFYLAPRYETRAVRVWVPAPVFVAPRPFFGFGFGFSDGHRDYHHDDRRNPAPPPNHRR